MSSDRSLLEQVSRLDFSAPVDPRGIPAAVLLALSPVDGADDLGLVLVRRPDSMRNHAGQVALPGGAVEPGDRDAIAAALREAHEEVGLEPAQVTVVGSLDSAYIPVSNFDVLPVVGLWDGRSPLRPNPDEVDGVLRPTLRQLADPANHGSMPLRSLVGEAGLRGRAGELVTPVFWVDRIVVWGFTAGLLAAFLRSLGLQAPPVLPALRP